MYYLSHHGIKGQRWGVMNGPPYPLDASDHSASEKKAGWRTSLRKSSKKESIQKINGLHLTDKQKRVIKIGSVIAASVLIAGGAVYLYKINNSSILNIGNRAINASFSDTIGGSQVNLKRLGRSFKDVVKDRNKLISPINNEIYKTDSGKINCAHTSVSYILNSLFDKNTKALPFSGIDETSGMVLNGRDVNVFDSIFKGINKIDYQSANRNVPISQAVKDIKNGSTGIMFIAMPPGFGHFINYEKDIKGVVSFIDAQSDDIFNSNDVLKMAFAERNIKPLQILDFSKAEIREDAENILKYFVKGF